MTCERYKPYEVLRLLPRATYSKRKAASIFRFFKSDRLGCGVSKDVLLRACAEAKMAKWGIAPVVISSDIVVFYLGPEHRLESAVAFINKNVALVSDKQDSVRRNAYCGGLLYFRGKRHFSRDKHLGFQAPLGIIDASAHP